MPVRQNLRHRSDNMTWTLVYALYLFMSIGLIIASEITVRYGGSFFGNRTIPAAANTSAEPGEGNNQAALEEGYRRDHALARSGVVGSVGLAIGSVAIIQIACTFSAHKFLDFYSAGRDATSEYRSRWALTAVTNVLNVILFGGNFSLCAGFVLTAKAISGVTTADQSSAPSYLIGCAIMAALSGATAGAAIVVDQLKFRGLRKIVEEEEREVEVEMEH